MELHAPKCIMKEMVCPMPGCEHVLKGPADQALSHFEQCPKVLVTCPECRETMKREEMETHP